MTSTSNRSRRARWIGLVAASSALALLLAACSLLLDSEKNQCSVDADCVSFGGRPLCQSGVCVASGLGPEGCFLGTPQTPEQFANQCSTAQCETFDNCARLGLCASNAEPAAAVTPPTPDGGTPPPPVDQSLPPCVVPGVPTVVITGSTAVQPFLSVVAPLLAADSNPYRIAYQPTGSCTGVETIFDPTKRRLKDNRPSFLFDAQGVPTPCNFEDTATPTGVDADIGVSDVFGTSCRATFVPNNTIAEYLGPIQPMTFVVPAASQQRAISAEMGRYVFGRGGADSVAAPWRDPALYFVRSSSSGTQQMLARAIDVDAGRWWGTDRGGSTAVRMQLLSVAPARADSAIGILSSDFADKERARLRILAFKGRGQICAYFPDSTEFTLDKQNVRDGHYPIWGPLHFFTPVSNGLPSPAAGAFLTRFTLDRLEPALLNAIIDAGLVPTCAMKVQRATELGPLSAFSPQYQCGCYFEARVNKSAPASCQACSGPADCPSSRPACNSGFCEVR